MNNISKSLENRIINFMINKIDFETAVKMAIEEENKFIGEMIEQTTERSQKAKKQICKNVYALAHVKNALQN